MSPDNVVRPPGGSGHQRIHPLRQLWGRRNHLSAFAQRQSGRDAGRHGQARASENGLAKEVH